MNSLVTFNTDGKTTVEQLDEKAAKDQFLYPVYMVFSRLCCYFHSCMEMAGSKGTCSWHRIYRHFYAAAESGIGFCNQQCHHRSCFCTCFMGVLLQQKPEAA